MSQRDEQDDEVPIWRRDFPYTAGGEERVTRREFTRYLTLASGAFAVGTVGVAGWTSLRQPPEAPERRIVALHDIDEGGTHLFRYPTDDDPAILIRTSGEEVVAYSQKCTHLGCVVYYAEDEDLLECPCHEGFFAVGDGHVVAGPPERPLARIAVEVREGEVWATGYEIRGA